MAPPGTRGQTWRLRNSDVFRSIVRNHPLLGLKWARGSCAAGFGGPRTRRRMTGIISTLQGGSVATILTPSEGNISRAADALRRGELVGMPTETVYGLAANAFDASAVARIFAAKDRPSFDPLIVHVVRPAGPLEREVLSGLEDEGIVEISRLPQLARERADVLLRRFWPGPLTLVLPRGRRIPDLVTSGLETVAIRMPAHPVAQALLKVAAIPLAAPSANRFGRISPTTAAHVVQELGDRIGIVIDGGSSTVGVESTVVAIGNDGTLSLLRPGGVAVEAIEATASVRLLRTLMTAAEGVPAASPGMS